MTRLVGAVGLVWIAVALVVVATGTAATSGGVFGVVTKTPGGAACIETQPCTKPASGMTLQVLSGARIVTKVVTSPNGAYRVHLRPGSYRLRVVGAFKATAISVAVGSGWTHRDIRLTSGSQSPSVQ